MDESLTIRSMTCI